MEIGTNNNDFSDMPPELKAEMKEVSQSRRDFMKVTGMAAMGAVIAGCTAEDRHVKPLIKKPEGITPGVAYNYASTCQGCSANCGTLMKVRDGRPIKLEGNAISPINGTGLCATGQAQLWTLYNPDRLHSPTKGGEPVEWSDIDAAAKAVAGGAVLLTGTINGPCANSVINKFKAKGGRHVSYDAVSCYAIAKAHGQTHGTPVIPGYYFDQATTVFSFDADFLGAWISPVGFARDWATRRDLKFGRDGKDMSRLVSFEARMSLTGANADERVRIKDSERGAVLMDLAKRLGGDLGAVGKHSVPEADMARLAEELKQAGRRALVITGSLDVNEQLVANWINNKLGAYGTTLDLRRPSRQKLGDDDALAQLIKDMSAGSVKTLIVWGVNPVYDLPNGAAFKEAMGKVANTIAISSHADETASECQWIAAEDDPLETWNDFEPVQGIFSLAQPGIRRLWNTRSGFASLLKWIGDPDGNKDYREVLKAFWEANLPRGMNWTQAVEQGTGGASGDVRGDHPGFNNAAMGAARDAGKVESATLEVVTYESYNLRDGRHATNGWLQEMADPMSRISWTNVAFMSPATMKAQGVDEGDMVELSVEGASCKVPANRQPGMADGVVAVSLGYGRTKAGPIVHGRGVEEDAVDPDLLDEGIHAIGGNAFPFIGAKSVSLSATGRTIRLAKVSTHDSQEDRPILKQTSLEQWKKNPKSGNEHEIPPVDITLWPRWDYKGHKWGMVVDLNSCIGCSACQVACSIENNVPVVGKEEVWYRREMHWIRVDTYYEDNDGSKFDGKKTEDINPEVGFQPMMCQHCDNAPCETVCPVIATSHSDEGLNVQAYNRCIGTRYCANNCPYKVRRFNFLLYQDWDTPQLKLQRNPDVTVRSRGVMEKCTYCTQRINRARVASEREGRKIRDGEVRTACQQACPSDAITFGDQNDAGSLVAAAKRDPRNYALLSELGTRPRTTYLAMVKNPNPELAG